LEARRDSLLSHPGSCPADGVHLTTIGSGSDTLILKMSEDAYLGDAQFTVLVDGTQLGGTFTTTASHATGASQTFTFKGDFGGGSHTLSVKFTNDLYGGASGADRNLYINAVTYQGLDTHQSATLSSAGAASLSLSGGTSPAVSETGDHGTLQKNLSQTGTYKVGGDQFVIGAGNAVAVTLGAGTSQIKFIGATK
jgi:Ca-dependent carbohydrate-binding module xylan-binding